MTVPLPMGPMTPSPVFPVWQKPFDLRLKDLLLEGRLNIDEDFRNTEKADDDLDQSDPIHEGDALVNKPGHTCHLVKPDGSQGSVRSKP